MGGGKKGVSPKAPAIASLQLQTSCWGRAIPLVYGMTRLAGNLLWYGDFKAIPHTQSTGGKGGGGGAYTTYTYQAAVVLGLCQGPISGVGRVWADKKVVTLSDIGAVAALGTATQSAPAWLTSGHPTEALGYSLTANLSAQVYDLGQSGNLPTHTVEVQGINYNSGGLWAGGCAKISAVLNDILTEPTRGVGFPSGLMGSLTNLDNYTQSLGLWVSPGYVDAARASDTVERLLKIANTAAVFSEGTLKLIPYADHSVSGYGSSYTVTGAIQYDLTDDDFRPSNGADPVIVERIASADAFNCVQVQFKDRSKEYANNIAEAKDDAAIARFGLRVAPTQTFDEIVNPVTARMVAQLLLQRYTLQRNTYKFTLPLTYAMLEPMDLVSLTESGGGLSGVPARITSVQENEDNSLDFEAEDYLGTVGGAPAYSYEVGGGYRVDYNASPGSVSAPYIFDAPGRMAPLGYEVWVAVAGAGALWGGATAWISTDGLTYKLADTIQGPSRYGVTTGTVAAGTDPDTTNTIPVDLSASNGTLSSGTATDADNGNTLCILGGELIAYETATLTGSHQYTLGTYLRRGVYGTANGAHASGANFARLDSALLKIPYDPVLVGQSIYLKFTSVNIWGGAGEGIDSVPAYAYTIRGPIDAPADVTGFAVAITTDGVLLTWNPVSTTNLKQYEVRVGASWGAGAVVGRSLTNQLKLPPQAVGATTWWVRAVDRQDHYSNNSASVTLSVVAPSNPNPSAQVIDNNILLSWSAATATQPILTYRVKRGSTWGGGTDIGTKNGLFTSVFETAAGTYTYWVAAVDIAGNEGTPGSVVASVSAPPDYSLKANYTSAFGGTLSNAMIERGAVVLPVDTTTTWAAHFTGHSWATPADQISAGYPIFIEPSQSTGYYEETSYDCGSTLATAKVTVALNTTTIGSPTIQVDISTSPDNTTWTTYTNVTSVLGSAFRYVRVRVTATSAGGTNLVTLNALNIRIELKLRSDFGSQAVLSTDVGGTVTTFNYPFLGVTALSVTPLSTAASFATVDFAGGANPTTFKILLWNTSGTRISGTVHWEARGY